MAETEVTVGAVESELLLELSEESSESSFAHEDIRITMLTIRTHQDNKFFIFFFVIKC